jgi:hypothetical protein
LLPNLVIAGVNKAGTTSLFSYLARHPEIGASDIKETCYFLPLRYGEQMPPLSTYQAYFSKCAGKRYILESTPGYFYGGSAIVEAIGETLKDARIIVVLREPIERLLSFFRFMKSMLQLDRGMTVTEYVEACEQTGRIALRERGNNRYFGIEGGRYADYIGDWFDVFDERLKIVFFDRLKQDRIGLLQELCAWLEIDGNLYEHEDLGVENRTFHYRNRSLHKLSLALNQRGERLFRANPRLKAALRRAYTTINGSPADIEVPAEIRIRLHALFADSNRRLSAELVRRGYRDLPTWLTDGHP